MYIYVCAYVFMCMYMYTYVYTCMYVRVYVYVRACIHIYMYDWYILYIHAHMHNYNIHTYTKGKCVKGSALAFDYICMIGIYYAHTHTCTNIIYIHIQKESALRAARWRLTIYV